MIDNFGLECYVEGSGTHSEDKTSEEDSDLRKRSAGEECGHGYGYTPHGYGAEAVAIAIEPP